jgi:hypothetical protein
MINQKSLRIIKNYHQNITFRKIFLIYILMDQFFNILIIFIFQLTIFNKFFFKKNSLTEIIKYQFNLIIQQQIIIFHHHR